MTSVRPRQVVGCFLGLTHYPLCRRHAAWRAIGTLQASLEIMYELL